MDDDHSPFRARRAVLVTMHGKESAIGPVLGEHLGLVIDTVSTIDTDQFGAFTGEIERSDTQYQTAIRKALAGMSATGCDLGLASEGSFNPHPEVPWLSVNRELVVLVDQRHNWVLEGWAASLDTSATQQVISSVEQALAFGQRVGFPAQGLVARLNADDARHMSKGIDTEVGLRAVVSSLLRRQPTGILLETDLRAHMNPKRRVVIRQAAADLAANALRVCPQCGAPGVRAVESLLGLPCEWCGTPTRLRRAEIYACVRCDYRREQPHPDGNATASPEYCEICNP